MAELADAPTAIRSPQEFGMGSGLMAVILGDVAPIRSAPLFSSRRHEPKDWLCRKKFISSELCYSERHSLVRRTGVAIDFQGAHFPKSVILYAVFFDVRYSVSYRDLEEIMVERGVNVDHATLNRWVVRYAPQIAEQAQKRKRPTLGSWRVDETYIKVKGKWTYLYRAVVRDGQTLDFMLSERRNLGTARHFFKKTIASNGVPNKIVIDKSRANLAGAQAVNNILKITGASELIKILQVRYLNNILEQDHRFIKRITKPMMGFTALHSASATIAGIEVAHMIRKKQFANDNRSPFEVFAELAA